MPDVIYIFEVEAALELPELGFVIGGFIPFSTEDLPDLNSKLILERPDGTTLETMVKGFPMVNLGRREGHTHFSIQLPHETAQHGVPNGTKVFFTS